MYSATDTYVGKIHTHLVTDRHLGKTLTHVPKIKIMKKLKIFLNFFKYLKNILTQTKWYL